MKLHGIIILLLLSTSKSLAQEEDVESTTSNFIAEETTLPSTTTTLSSTTETNVKLDYNLRSALLKALTDLENEDEDQEEKNVAKAQASAITIFSDDETDNAVDTSEENNEEETTETQTEQVLFQKSEIVQEQTIKSLEQSPLDPIKDAEQILTSASNNLIGDHQNGARSISTGKIETSKKFPNFNSINTDSKKLVEKFSIGKAVDQNYQKTFTPIHTTYSTSKSSVTSQVKDVDSTTSIPETTTTAAPVAATEENEAKVEQVQFFSAPLVAAFTVHQDEQGLPNKVEPIYKKTESQALIQPTSFNSLDLQQKQQLLEEELEKLRNQQFTSRNNFRQAVNQNFNQFGPVFSEPDRSVVTKLATIDPASLLHQNTVPFLNRFQANEAVVNPKQPGEVNVVPSVTYDPVIEAGKLPRNAQILPNKEPTGFRQPQNFVQPNSQNSFFNSFAQQPSQVLIQPSLSNFIQPSQGFVQSNQNYVQQIPNNFVQSQPNRFLRQETPVGNFANQFQNQNRFLRQELGTGNFGINQPTFSIVPAQQPFPPKHEFGYFPDSRFQRSEVRRPQSQVRQNNGFVSQNNRFLRSNQEGTFGSRFVQPVYQNYRYTNSFGYNIPLH